MDPGERCPGKMKCLWGPPRLDSDPLRCSYCSEALSHMSGLYDGLLPPTTNSERYSAVPPPASLTTSESDAPASTAPSTAKPPAPAPPKNAWSSNAKFLASVNLRKKAAAAAPPKPVAKRPTQITPAAALIPSSSDRLDVSPPTDDIKDEYEPAKPNEYEDYLAQQAKKRSQPEDDSRGGSGFSLKKLEEKYREGEFGSRLKKTGWQESPGLGKGSESDRRSDPYGPGKIVSNPSRVVLLTNMVARSEVDATLESETQEECQKYGTVLCCAIREQPLGVPEEEAVQTFVKFADKSAAERAVADLHGRFFAGRKVQAHFYDERTFSGEFPNKT